MYKLTWKDEDTNRVGSKKFTNERGKDHSAFDAACEMAQVLDGNMWPWIIERDGEEILPLATVDLADAVQLDEGF